MYWFQVWQLKTFVRHTRTSSCEYSRFLAERFLVKAWQLSSLNSPNFIRNFSVNWWIGEQWLSLNCSTKGHEGRWVEKMYEPPALLSASAVLVNKPFEKSPKSSVVYIHFCQMMLDKVKNVFIIWNFLVEKKKFESNPKQTLSLCDASNCKEQQKMIGTIIIWHIYGHFH